MKFPVNTTAAWPVFLLLLTRRAVDICLSPMQKHTVCVFLSVCGLHINVNMHMNLRHTYTHTHRHTHMNKDYMHIHNPPNIHMYTGTHIYVHRPSHTQSKPKLS